MPRWRTRKPLTPEQRETAGADDNLRVALGVALRFARSWPRLRDEFRSAAGWALCVAAQGYGAERATRSGFAGYLAAVTKSLCWEAVRMDRPEGYKNVEDPERRPSVVQGNVRSMRDVPERRDPVGWELEEEDAVEALIARLPEPDRTRFRRYFLCAGRTNRPRSELAGGLERLKGTVRSVSLGEANVATEATIRQEVGRARSD